jgi:serine/threonine protein kinase
MDNLIGRDLGRYHILGQLGQGGMATVYKAHDTRLERDVAVKVIRTDQFAPAMLEKILKRFEREAKVLARLQHPNIVGVIDYGEYEGAPYLVMEFLPGGTVKQHLGKPLPWQDAARLLHPIAEALEYAHEQGLIHRDVKPGNILLTLKGQPMLTDFGIAKILDLDDATSLTGTGVGVGTPEYMAPEQWTNKTSTQSDIYGLGVVLYELVTGYKPYTADTPAAILLKQANEPLPRPGKYIPGLPDLVERVLIKALAKKPEDRFVNMSEFATALQLLAEGKIYQDDTHRLETGAAITILQQDDTGFRNGGSTIYESPTPAYVPRASTRTKAQDLPPKRSSGPDASVLWGMGIIAVIILAMMGIYILYTQNGSASQQQPVSSENSYEGTATMEELLAKVARAEKTETALAARNQETPTTEIQPTDTNEPTAVPILHPKSPPSPMFSASQPMFCRSGPSTAYDPTWNLNAGDTVPVIGAWYQDFNWILVDINNSSTRTDCCWVSGVGTLNVNLNSLKPISIIPDRKNCSSVK